MGSLSGRVLLSAIVSCSVLVSCSSGSKPTATTATSRTVPPTPVSLTKAEYIARANALCQTMNSQVAALGNPGSDPSQQARYTDEQAAITAATLRRIRNLPVPSGEATALSAIYARVDKIAQDAKRLSAALRAGNISAAQEAERIVQADSKAANTASIAYGLTVCGS